MNFKSIKLQHILGYIITIASFYYIYTILSGYKLEHNFNNYFNIKNSLIFILLIFGHSIVLLFSAYSWKLTLEYVSNKKIHLNQIFIVYIQTNIAKYLPGNVLHYVGRNYMGTKLGWNNLQLATSTLIELIFSIVIPISILIVFYCVGLLVIPSGIVNFELIKQYSYYIIIAFGIVLFILYFFRKSIQNFLIKRNYWEIITSFFNELLNKRFYFLILKITLLMLISFFYNGVLFFLISEYIIQYPLNLSDFFNITSSLSLASYSGILTPGVPGGIGVKESVSVFFICGFGYNTAQIVLLTLVSRVIFILSEILMYILSLFIVKMKFSNTL